MTSLREAKLQFFSLFLVVEANIRATQPKKQQGKRGQGENKAR